MAKMKSKTLQYLDLKRGVIRSAPFTVFFKKPVTITLSYSQAWASLTVGGAVTANATTTGGSTPFTYNVETGSLPAGLNINTTSGLISGTPLGSGTGSFSIKLTDSASDTVTSSVYNWTVT